MNEWPEYVTVIDPTHLESHPHVYSTHPQSIPGIWAMFRKEFHKSLMPDILSCFVLAVYVLARQSPSPRSTERRAALDNLTCSILGYTDGQSTQTLQLTEITHASRKNSSLTGPPDKKNPRQQSQGNTTDQSTHEECDTHTHDGQILPIRSRNPSRRHRPRRPHR